MNVFSETNIGLSRAENQDRVKVTILGNNAAFAVICDGMGGENAGSVASEKAINVIYDRVTKVYRDDYDEKSVKNLLISAVTTANAVVFDDALGDDEKAGMGTTCVLALKKDNMLHVVSVGDSRVYLVNDTVRQITKDHTMVMKMYENGEITKEELKVHPQRNYITKAVGVSEMVVPDYFEVAADDGSAVILCSDGLSNYCEDEDLYRAVKESKPEEIAGKLVKFALDGGGNDNVTVAVII